MKNIREKETRFILIASALGIIAIVILIWINGIFEIGQPKYTKKNVIKMAESGQILNLEERNALIEALARTKDVYSDEEKLKIINALNKKQ